MSEELARRFSTAEVIRGEERRGNLCLPLGRRDQKVIVRCSSLPSRCPHFRSLNDHSLRPFADQWQLDTPQEIALEREPRANARLARALSADETIRLAKRNERIFCF